MLHTVKEMLQDLEKMVDNDSVAMSLCALIYSNITKITSVDDMTQIMIVGIQLYSCLSLLQCLSNFSTLNTVTVILVTSTSTVYATHRLQHLKHSWH